MSRIKEIRKISPYAGINFKELPSEKSEKFLVYLPKYEDNVKKMYSSYTTRQSEQKQAVFPSIKNVTFKSNESNDALQIGNRRPIFQSQELEKIPAEVSSKPTQYDKNCSDMSLYPSVNNVKNSSSSCRTISLPDKASIENCEGFKKNTIATESANSNNTAQLKKSRKLNTRQRIRNLLQLPCKIENRNSIKLCSNASSFFSPKSSEFKLNKNKSNFNGNTQIQHSTFYNPNKGIQLVRELEGMQDVLKKQKNWIDMFDKVKKLNLFEKDSPKLFPYKGVGKTSYVYNDFHTKSTNPGYSRKKEDGCPYWN